MKARKIRKYRKIIIKPDYLIKRYLKLLSQLDKWSTFYKFECSSFFRGSIVAEYNCKVYNANVPRIERKIEWYGKRIDFTQNGKLYKNDI